MFKIILETKNPEIWLSSSEQVAVLLGLIACSHLNKADPRAVSDEASDSSVVVKVGV